MKLVHKSLERDGAGVLALIPEESEDMWHAFNLIQEGDAVRASTVRKVTNESATGSRTSDIPRGQTGVHLSGRLRTLQQ